MILTQEYQEEWSLLKKTLFRFIFAYFSLYIFLMFLGSFFEVPFRWVGQSILGIDYSYDVKGFGSGDHTYAYVTLFINFLLAIILSLTWTILDAKRKSYNKLMYWFITILRIYLVYYMCFYGFVKVIQLQFPYPSLTRMMQPLGDFSPMGLAWTYLGYSKGFNLFMGVMEISGGLLLIPRRTSTLGAFMTFGVMTHVAVMNFMFDIPVKIFSVHLALMALFIFSTDLKRFISVFIKNRAVEAYHFYNPIEDKTYHKVIFWLKIASVFLLFGSFSLQGLGNDRGKNVDERSFLYGVWDVEAFIKSGDSIQSEVPDNEQWQYMIIEQKGQATVKMINDMTVLFKFEIDTISKKVMIHSTISSMSETYNFDYQLMNDDTLILEGELYLYDFKITLRKKNMLLDSRGFNWIHERPYNR